MKKLILCAVMVFMIGVMGVSLCQAAQNVYEQQLKDYKRVYGEYVEGVKSGMEDNADELDAIRQANKRIKAAIARMKSEITQMQKDVVGIKEASQQVQQEEDVAAKQYEQYLNALEEQKKKIELLVKDFEDHKDTYTSMAMNRYEQEIGKIDEVIGQLKDQKEALANQAGAIQAIADKSGEEILQEAVDNQ